MSGREDFLAAALAERGQCVRADGTTKYGRWFAEAVHDSSYATGDFCAMGLLWTANETGQLDVLGGAHRAWAWVPSWWAHWKSLGRAMSTPARGRIVFFDFNRSGEPEHVGAVLEVRTTTLITVEYNTLGGRCAVRDDRRRADVLGYGDPAWPSSPGPAVSGDDCWFMGAS